MNTTHGHWNGGRPTKLWRAHRTMLTRCYHQAADSYARYSQKGIVVCKRWLEGENGLSGFECFAKDVGDPPSPTHTLDRIDNNSGYCPENCRWATWKQQANNRENTIWIKALGRKQTMSEWQRETGLSDYCINYRLKVAKMSPDDCMTKPSRRSK